MEGSVKLSVKQRAFIDYYIETGNATKAAELAGYSKKTAKEMGYENLTKPHIKLEIDERLQAIQDARIAKADEVLIYLTSVMRRELKEYVPVTLRTQRVQLVECGTDKDGLPIYKPVTLTEEQLEIAEIPSRLSDSNKAAELLGKRYKMWTDRLEQEVDGEIIVRMEGIEDLSK